MTTNRHLLEEMRRTVAHAIEEDIGDGDRTAALIPATAKTSATIITREQMTMAGQPWVDEIFRSLDSAIELDWQLDDGHTAEANDVICHLQGPARAVLSGERAALNLLQTLSATATVTAAYVAAVAGTDCQILDTRKTLPGLRLAQKYAVRQGGGGNHRIGLFDAILIKENHIMSTGGIGAAVRKARELQPDMLLEVEVESIAELREALSSKVDRLLLDNFSLELLAEAVKINRKVGAPPVELEASGGLTLDGISAIARTGVDYISVGALTKNIQAIDLSMRFHG